MLDRICQAIAGLLPRRIAYWCYIRVHAHATVTEFTDRMPDEVTCFEAMQAWPA